MECLIPDHVAGVIAHLADRNKLAAPTRDRHGERFRCLGDEGVAAEALGYLVTKALLGRAL